MPKKGKKGGKKGKKGKGKKKTKGPANSDALMKKLLMSYEKNCHVTESQMCPWIKNHIKQCIEDNAILTRFILEAVPVEKSEDVPILIEPLLAALRQERYVYIKDLHIWKYPMSCESTATLALLLEKPFYPIRQLELLDCLIDPWGAQRLSRAFKTCEVLTHVNLDYNEFGDEGCKNLCKGLEGNVTLLSISLCFCDLDVDSGTYLGKIVSTTAVRELYLDGNNLLCDGAIEIIKLCAEQAEYEGYQRAEKARLKLEQEEAAKEKGRESRFSNRAVSATGSKEDKMEVVDTKKKKKKGKKKKKKKEPPGPPPVGPWIYKLHLADNGIDNFDHGAKFAPVVCMRLFKKLIMYSECFEELDLEDNMIGDMAGKEVVDGLEHRKEEKLGGLKLKTTHKMNADTFNSIVKLGTGLKKKKKKGKKKKK